MRPNDEPARWALLSPGYSVSVAVGFWSVAAAHLLEHGFAVVGCQFWGSGFAEDMCRPDRLDRSSGSGYREELRDLGLATDWVRQQSWADPDRGGVVGHSRGGGMAVVHAASDQRMQAVVTWNAIDRVLRFSPDRIAEWRERGRIEVTHWGAGSRVELDRRVLEDAERHRDDYEPYLAAARLAAPLLVIQASDDSAVVEADGRRLAAAGDAEFVLVDGADHAFGMATRRPRPVAVGPQFGRVLEATTTFLEAHL